MERETKGLGRSAYGGVSGEDYKPYVGPGRSVRELTLRAVLSGILIGVIFGAANAYLGLKVGITVSASIPAAVIAIALSRSFLGRASVLENNMIQTVGSAGESLAAGVIFTIPALIVLGYMPELSKVFILAALGGLLGVLFMIPLRRYLMVREHGKLPFPEGTACGEVLVAGDRSGGRVRQVMTGLGIGALYRFLMEGLGLWNDVPSWRIRGYDGAEVGVEAAPALLGVGYVIGPRIAAVMLGGGALGWLVLIPFIKMMGAGLGEALYPATGLISDMSPIEIWDNYIRYIGAGAVAFGGLVTLVKAIPTMVKSFGAGMRAITDEKVSGGAVLRTAMDLPMKLVLGGAAVIAVLIWALPQVPVGAVGALLIVVFSFFFVTVSSRIVGLIGSSSNPASGMTIATLLATSLVFLAMGWTGPAGMVAAVSVGAVVCIAICIAGDTSQDLKTGFLVGATPRKQQFGEMIGVLSSAIVVGWIVFFLHRAYGIGSEKLSAPQAVLMSMVVKGVLTQSLPWTLVIIGAFLAGVVELLGIPSLPFAVGLYLPIRLSTPIMMGGLVRLLSERTSCSENELCDRRERGVLLSSGLIAGGAIMGVIVAALVNAGVDEHIHVGYEWAGPAAGAVTMGCFLLLVALLAGSAGLLGGRGGRRGR
ncbi:MAG: oligopeptide transporter, OPT family [Candidatus Eisenbacteria bacterium]|nr:oligopeptide transporter, OPT family [Candidatus Eisenbacteria bacterium]